MRLIRRVFLFLLSFMCSCTQQNVDWKLTKKEEKWVSKYEKLCSCDVVVKKGRIMNGIKEPDDSLLSIDFVLKDTSVFNKRTISDDKVINTTKMKTELFETVEEIDLFNRVKFNFFYSRDSSSYFLFYEQVQELN